MLVRLAGRAQAQLGDFTMAAGLMLALLLIFLAPAGEFGD